MTIQISKEINVKVHINGNQFMVNLTKSKAISFKFKVQFSLSSMLI